MRTRGTVKRYRGAMGVERTVMFACGLAPVVLLLAAMVAIPARRASALANYRPACITLLVGTVLALAYVVGFTVAVEYGAHQVRALDPTPDIVQACPAFTTPNQTDGRCVLIDTADASVTGDATTGDGSTPIKYVPVETAFENAPNARAIAKELVSDRAPGIWGPDAAAPDRGRSAHEACCVANASPQTDLSTMCPSSDLMKCTSK